MADRTVPPFTKGVDMTFDVLVVGMALGVLGMEAVLEADVPAAPCIVWVGECGCDVGDAKDADIVEVAKDAPVCALLE